MAYRNTGWALFETTVESEELTPRLIDWGLDTNSDSVKDLNGINRVAALVAECRDYYERILNIILQNSATACSIEVPFGSRNMQSAIAMGMIYGLVSFISYEAPYLDLHLVHPRDSKEMVLKALKQKQSKTCSKKLVSMWAQMVANSNCAQGKQIDADTSDHVTDAIAAFYAYWTQTKSRAVYQHKKKGLRKNVNQIEFDID